MRKTLSITCAANWYHGPGWKRHENFCDIANILQTEFLTHCGEFAVDVDAACRQPKDWMAI